MKTVFLLLISASAMAGQSFQFPIYFLLWPELDASSSPTGQSLTGRFQTKSEAQFALDQLTSEQRLDARAIEITATSVTELSIDEICRRVIAGASFVPQIVQCDPTAAWATGAAWSGRSVDSPDDMTAADTQVGETACRSWGIQASTDVFPGTTPKRAAAE